MRTSDIHWVAGLLEGEGCFYTSKDSPGTTAINMSLTDKDVIDRAASILGTRVYDLRGRKPGDKPAWQLYIGGKRARGWMMILYQLMGQRRKAKIKNVLDGWRSSPGRVY